MKSFTNARKLRLESLEERTLLAVLAGGIETGAEIAKPTEATTWIVNTLDDPIEWDTTDEVLSLREAIDNAADGDTIVFDSGLAGGTIVLSDGLEISRGISIDAISVNGVTIDGDQKWACFSIGADKASSPVNLIGLTITGGLFGHGGGIDFFGGTLNLTNCTITKNTARGNGGGIFQTQRGILTVTDCVISDNIGGGIYKDAGDLTIVNSAIFGNKGIGVYSDYGTLTVNGCTITGNESGVSNYSRLTCVNSIIARNFSGNFENSGGVSVVESNIIDSDPGFVVAPEFDEAGNLTNFNSIDLRLSLASPAINMGNNDYVTSETDLSRNLRIFDAIVDLGAYEFHNENASVVVTTLEDVIDAQDGVISLREAVEVYANDGDTVTFASDLAEGTIVLDGIEIVIDKGITVDASEIGGITISADNKNRVFHVRGGTSDRPVDLICLTITAGNVSNDDGGGIYNRGTLTLTDSTVSGNTASRYGGGIYNDYYGTLTITNSTISGNTASSSPSSYYAAHGGGIYNDYYGTLTITNSTISGNTASSYGGGICNNYSTLTLTNCTVVENTANEDGGGIYNYYNSTLTLTNSTVSWNSAWFGGGIYNYYNSTLTLTDSTVSENTARLGGGIYNSGMLTMTDSIVSKNAAIENGDGVNGFAGGIHSSGTLTITNSTISGNTASNGAGGIYNRDTLTITNSTISGNTASYDGGGIFNWGTLTITNSTISGNTASYRGGGIYNYSTLTLTDSTVSGNTANYSGGGIYNYGTLTMTNTTVSGNTASSSEYSYGGGIYNYSGTLTLTNSTVSGSTALRGGGICNWIGTLTITNSTISGNTASYGGGIYNNSDLNIYNSIVVNNRASNGADIYRTSGTVKAYNTLSSYTGWTESEDCIFYDPSIPLFTDPENGDYTLARYSQAINVGNNEYVNTETDLAGNYRIIDDTVDLGAYEYQKIRLDAPSILTGNRGVYVSYGANRHQLTWDAVENAVGYELAYSTDGENWSGFQMSETSAVVTGLAYGDLVTYRVRSLARGARYDDSPWSESKSFNVCPMDINNDGDISGSDRTIMASAWLAEEGDEGYQYFADINGDGEVSNTDRPFIGQNWNKEAGDDDLVYPRALRAADAAFAGYEAGDLDVDIDVF